MTSLPPRPGSSGSSQRPAGAVSLQVDATLRLLSAEPEIGALLQAEPTLIKLHRGRLCLPQHQPALELAVAALAAGSGPGRRGLALQRPGRLPLTIRLERAAGAGPLRLWLHVVDAAVPQLDGELLATMFGLTSAEQRVALLLAQGLTADDMAARLGVQDNTVRSHVKQLLAKTQTHRQVQLVALLWRSAAVSHAGHEASTPAPLMPGGAPPVPPASCPNG